MRHMKDSKKYGCVCTCCHRSNLPRYDCVIFLKQNYNFKIHAVANTLSKQYREPRQKEFICKPCHKQLKADNYMNNIQNCSNSDMFGSDIIHDQHTHHNVEPNITHSTNNITCNLEQMIHSSLPYAQITVSVHVATTQIYQDHNVSYSKNQIIIWTILSL